MKLKILSTVLALFFVLGTVGAGMAAKKKCEVEAVDGMTVTLKCEKEDAFKVGDKLKISPPRTGAAVEGC